jgi:hypothetical protein
MLGSVTGWYDGDAHTVVHRAFFLGEGKKAVERDVLSDLERLREYLKGVWRVMVIYDLVIREAGGDPDWAKECKHVFHQVFWVRYK